MGFGCCKRVGFILTIYMEEESPTVKDRSSQSILNKIIPEYSLGGLMLKLKLQYFGHLIQRADSLEKTLICHSKNRRCFLNVEF